MTNTADTPTEALERTYPMRVLRYRLRRVSELTGLVPGDGREGFALWIAVAFGRLAHKGT